MDCDGTDELIVSSKPIIEDDEYWGSCFSIWDVTDTGEAVCLLAKRGQGSRFAKSYHIVEYGEQPFLLESYGGGSSGYKEGYRALYCLSDGTISLYKTAHFYEEYDDPGVIEEFEYTIDNAPSTAEDVSFLIEAVGKKVLISQDMGRD